MIFPKKSLGSLGEENGPLISSIIKGKMVEAAGIEPATHFITTLIYSCF